MRKSILLFVMAFLMYGMQTSVAQITSLYSFSESSATYTHLTGATLSTASGDDGEQTSVPIGFSFDYDLQTYTTLTIGVNGGLSFTLTDISYANQLSSTSKKIIIAPLWDDLYARIGDSVKIFYKTEGTTPNRTFTVEWKNISWRNAGDTVNFQVVLEETTNKILFKYGPNYSTNTGRSASIGINDHTGGSNHFLSIVPGLTATASSSISTDTLTIASYPGNGKVYIFTYTPPTCLPPSSPTTSNITTVSATLGWTETGTATQWDIEYGPAGFTQGTGTLTNVTVNPTTILSLSPATTYDWYVRARCSSSDSSTWLTGNSFTTACATITSLPWVQGFESMTSTGSGVIPNCMAEVGDWATASSSQNYNRAAHSGSKYIYTKYSADDWLMSPEFSLSAGVSYDFTFYYVTDGNSGWTTLETKMSHYQNKDSMNISVGTAVSGPNNTTYQKYTATFTPSATGLYYIGIHVVATGSPWYITFDDLKLDVSPSCTQPSSPTTSNITTVSATLGWTETGTATQWDIEYGPAGFTQGTGTLTNVTTNPTTILSLSPATTYDWYVRARCSSNDSSTWLTGNSFTTACATITTLPWVQGFETMTSTGSGVVPNCMAEVGDWATASVSQSYNRAAHLGSKYIYTKYSADDWLMSPEFSLSAGVSYDFTFYYVTDGNSGWTTLETKMSNYQDKDSMNISIGTAVSGPNNTTYQKYKATFTPSATGLYYIGIHVVATSSPWYISFDDLKLEVTPSCTQPTTQVTSNIQTTSAVLNWTEAGTATTWDIEYGPSGFTQGTGTTLTGVVSKPDTLTGLTPSTTYDWYVRASCGVGSNSPWEGPSSFTTLCLANTLYPYTEGFENSVAPQCWSVINVSGTAADWGQNTGTKHPSNNAAHEGSKVAFFNAFSASSGQESILETKTFNTASLINPAFSFYMFHDGGYASSNDYLLVKVNDGSGWTLVDSLKRNNGLTGWVNYQYNLNNFDSLVKIGFDAVSGYGNDIHIDAFYLGEEVSINLGVDTAICAGSDITIGETNNTNYSYNWFIAGSSTVIDTNSIITIDSAYTYILVKSNSFVTATDTIIISINQIASISFSGLASSYCTSDTAVTLTGTPSTGVFVGSGINGNTFNPTFAMSGQVVISYSLTDANGCSAITFDTTNIGITPIITTSPDTAVCFADSIKIGAYAVSVGGVFFSEYIEGSSNNKALEIYNGTGQPINLDKFSIMTNYNGNPWSGQYHFPTGSILAAGDVFVIANQNSDTTILKVTDDTLAYNAGGYVVSFNGDDVRALFYHSSPTDSIMIDIIGANDLSDPGYGWDVAGVSTATKDHSLIRKSAVIHGDTNWVNIAGTDSLSSSYLVYPKNTFSYLGSHTSTPLPTPTFSWSNGAVTNETVVKPTSITTFTVNASNGSCQVMDSVIVNVHALPVVNITAPDTFCNTTSALFDAGTGFTSYLWSTNANTQTISLDSNKLSLGDNTIWVKVGDNNGCFASDTTTIFMANCLGINPSENPIAIKIYPNPNNGKFTIMFEGVQGKTIVEIIDINGRTIKRAELNISGTTHQKYNLTDITPGFYQIRVTNNNSTRNTKIIVK